MITVLHLSQESLRGVHFMQKDEIVRLVSLVIRTQCASRLYTLVAEVDTDNLDIAFEKTNHIEHDWAENEGVKVLNKGGNRSTSVGDVMIHNGKDYVVAPIGFEQI